MESKMLEQLEELLEMQKALDEEFMKSNRLTYDKHIADNMRVALIVEIGELMNEFPTEFKHWKKRAVDNREKGLIEYVDCLHFCLSLFNYEKATIFSWLEYDRNTELKEGNDTLYETLSLITSIDYEAETKINYLFELGNYLGFTWDEIYQTYKDKNAINYERIKKGY